MCLETILENIVLTSDGVGDSCVTRIQVAASECELSRTIHIIVKGYNNNYDSVEITETSVSIETELVGTLAAVSSENEYFDDRVYIPLSRRACCVTRELLAMSCHERQNGGTVARMYSTTRGCRTNYLYTYIMHMAEEPSGLDSVIVKYERNSMFVLVCHCNATKNIVVDRLVRFCSNANFHRRESFVEESS